MQALIDFDGWRKWKKDFEGTSEPLEGGNGGATKGKEETEQDRVKREQKEAKKAALLAKMGQG